MIFFLFLYAIECKSRDLASILAIFVYYFISGAITNYKYANSLGLIMPVTTRSKARLLQNTSLALPQVCLECSPLSSSTYIPPAESTTMNMSRLPFASKSPVRSTVFVYPDFSSTDMVSNDVDSSSLVVSSDISEFQNFKLCSHSSMSTISNFSSSLSHHNCHNSLDFKNSIMESDCKDEVEMFGSSEPSDLKQLIDSLAVSLSSHISTQTAIIQDKIQENEVKIQESHVSFKQEVRTELDEFRELLAQQQKWIESKLNETTPSLQPSPTVVPSSSAVSSPPPSIPVVSPTPIPDFQTQMLLMITDSFSKLSTALTEQKQDSKGDWHKFSGDSKKFRAWYLGILAHLSLSPWSDLYDASRHDVVLSTTNSSLNGKLYSKLLLSLDGMAYQNFVSRKHLRANGIALLRELVQTYKPKNVPEILAAKTAEFWGNTKRLPTESIDSYYDRFQEFLDDFLDADEPIAPKAAIRHFIFTLGSEFETIQNNFRLNNLPTEWQTTDWPTILKLCRDYYNSIKPNQVTSKRPSPSGDSIDRENHQRKVKEWFLNPSKHKRDLENCQKQHPGKCIYHLSKTHPTEKCFIKLECDKLIDARKGTGSSTPSLSTTTGQLRHITEDCENSDDLEMFVSDDVDYVTNDTNEDALIYFARLSNHYLRLATTGNSTFVTSRHPMKYPVIADSGANHHMFKEREFFVSMHPATGQVILGDGKTNIDIKGIGTVKCYINGHFVELQNVRYIPGLGESIYSLFLHIQQDGHGLESTFDKGLFITFPTFKSQAIIGPSDIYLDIQPYCLESTPSFTTTNISSNVDDSISASYLNNHHELSVKDNLLPELRQYYSNVKTKRQLQLDVPAGFRELTSTQKLIPPKLPPRKSSSLSDLESHQHLSHPDLFSSIVTSDDETVKTSNIDNNVNDDPSSTTHPLDLESSSTTVYSPIVRSVDKPSSSLPASISMNEDYIKACVGYRRVDTMKRHFSTLYQPTIKLDNTPADAVLSPGTVATLKKKPRNTVPVPRPLAFADVLHMDIIFGTAVAVGNIHYGLLFTDRFSRMTYLYPLQNLTSDIPRQLEAFFAHIGIVPKRLISDFDLKLIGGKAREYLNKLLIHVNAAPAHRQDKNGLAERHWQTMISMARNWLAAAELPSTFWFYAVRRASEVCNYFPCLMDDGSYTTPFELVHKEKPDLRVLFKMFSLAAVRRERVGDTRLNKFDSQTVPMITLGRCPNSNGLLFFNPANNTFVSSIDYVFQPNVTSGARFGYKYQSGSFIYRLDESTTIFQPQFPLESQVLVHTHSPPHIAKVVGVPTYERPDVYTVSFSDGSIAEYHNDGNILELVPDNSHVPQPVSLLPHWIQGGANVTLFLQSMTKPRHGKLFLNSDMEWVFCPGTSVDVASGILLPNLSASCQNLIDTGQLFRGHTKFRRVYQTRNQIHLRDTVLRHVTAHGLSSLVAPSSLKQISKLTEGDQKIWHAAYDEEFDGLSSLPTWEVITEDQFKRLSKGNKALPSMAIATIKYDELNRPKRVKYRIVVLGNMDYHQWSKESTSAPVMSQLELRVLTSLAVHHHRILKNCDIKQAFVQSSLPVDEEYFVKPPVGCRRSQPGSYWRLLRSLYGLRRAPKLWFTKLRDHLLSMGLKQSSISPCLFVGTLVEGHPPIYIGIYVDDIIYFSASDQVEKEFEKQLSTIGNVDFMGQVSHFLGIEFSWRRHDDGHLSVSLTQQSFAENLVDSVNCSVTSTSTFVTPYRSGLAIDSIPISTLPAPEQDQLRLYYQSLVGSLNWLAHTTRPDLATIVSLLAQHQSNPSSGHVDAALHVIKYVAQTKHLGIYFTSDKRSTLETFLHFPLPPSLLSMADANWGPQDASTSRSKPLELSPFVSRSMSAFYVDLYGPLHWMSKRQSVTAGSSAEAEIYATNECVKFLLELVQVFEFLGVKDIFMPGVNVIYNDNKACVDWSKLTTSKGLRHIQMRENHVRENIQNHFVSVQHIDGKLNLADIFTKEMKDTSHFVELRDLMMCPRFHS